MSLLNTVSPEQANGKVADVYAQVQQGMGRVPGALQMFSPSPDILVQTWEGIGYYRSHPTLSAPLLAMVRMLVSQENDCEYCVGFNAGMLINVCGLTAEQVAATKKDPASAPLGEKDRAMLLFILKATRDSQAVNREDVERLKALGWTDRDLMDGVVHGARNMAVDVVFNTFKIDKDF